MTVEELLKLQIAFNHILEDRINTDDFTILDKYGYVKYKVQDGVQYILYPNKADVIKILESINKQLKK